MYNVFVMDGLCQLICVLRVWLYFPGVVKRDLWRDPCLLNHEIVARL